VIDDQLNKKSPVRGEFGIKGELCDLLIFYSNPDSNNNYFCLVELKPDNAPKAISQIINTLNVLKSKFQTKHCGNVKWIAYIKGKNTSAPGGENKDKKDRKTLDEKLGKHGGKNAYDISKEEDLGIFLRKFN
jgi:hypothetical protein